MVSLALDFLVAGTSSSLSYALRARLAVAFDAGFALAAGLALELARVGRVLLVAGSAGAFFLGGMIEALMEVRSKEDARLERRLSHRTYIEHPSFLNWLAQIGRRRSSGSRPRESLTQVDSLQFIK